MTAQVWATFTSAGKQAPRHRWCCVRVVVVAIRGEILDDRRSGGSSLGRWPLRTNVIAGTADHGLRSAVAKTVNASGPPSRSTRRDSLDAAAGSAINMYPERHR